MYMTFIVTILAQHGVNQSVSPVREMDLLATWYLWGEGLYSVGWTGRPERAPNTSGDPRNSENLSTLSGWEGYWTILWVREGLKHLLQVKQKTFYKCLGYRNGTVTQECGDFHHPHISICHSYILKHHSDHWFVSYNDVLHHCKGAGCPALNSWPTECRFVQIHNFVYKTQ